MRENKWIHCPVCGNKTRLQIRQDNVLLNFPLYCPKCKQGKRLVSGYTLNENFRSRARNPEHKRFALFYAT